MTSSYGKFVNKLFEFLHVDNISCMNYTKIAERYKCLRNMKTKRSTHDRPPCAAKIIGRRSNSEKTY